MTRHQRECARAAGACFGLLAMILAGVALVSFGGCAAPEDGAAVESLAVEDLGPGSDCPGVAPLPLRVMPAGDSITCGTDGGYRAPLFASLGALAESVGPRPSVSYCGGPGAHAGLPGSHTTGYAGYLPGYLAKWFPDVVLMMLGTNGDGGGAEYVRDLVRPTLDSSPTVRLLVGAIPAGPAQGDYPGSFNASVAAALELEPELGARLWWVPDTGAVSRPEQFGADGVHPSAAGYAALADAWRVGLVRAGLVPR